ncbi:MAG: hypothetical protein AB1805_07635 [Nitrospirota bacterium]
MYIFAVVESASGAIKACYEALTLPDGSSNPLAGNVMPEGHEVVRVNIDILTADYIRLQAAAAGMAPSQFICQNYNADMQATVAVPQGLTVPVPVKPLAPKA